LETLRNFFGAVSRLPTDPGSDCYGLTTDASHHGADRARPEPDYGTTHPRLRCSG